MLVKKLKKGNFQTIESGKTEEQMIPRHSKLLTTWKNKFNITFNDISTDIQKVNALTSCIVETYPNLASRRIHLEALANILLAIDKVKYKKTANWLFTHGIVLQNEIALYTQNQEATEKEKSQFVSRDVILTKMRDIDMTVSLDACLKKLILALAVLYPPLRLDYLNMEIVDDEMELSLEKNYYDNGVITINKDKVSEKIGPTTYELVDGYTHHDNVQYLFGTELKQIIAQSLDLWERPYLLWQPGDFGKPLKMSTYNILIRHALEVPATQNIFRKSYISWFYGLPVTRHEKQIVAGLMRHSIGTAEGTYLKLDL